MNKEIEEMFAKTFLDKRINERVIFELQSNKKRGQAISRFCHSSEDMIKESCIYKKTDDFNILLSTIKDFPLPKVCYVISSATEFDGKEILLETALKSCVGYGWPSILILNETLAIIETEQEYGASEKYILHTSK